MPPLTGIGTYRVRKGDRLIVRAINTTAAVLTVRLRVLYDDGDDDDLYIDPSTGAGDRSVQIFEGRDRAKKNGWIVGGEATVGQVATKRGQFYIDVSTTDGSVVTPLAKGYVYDGHSLTPGEFVEPGPGGGEGNIRSVTGTNRAAGVEVSESVPANVTWKLRSLVLPILIGAVTFEPVLRLNDGAGLQLAEVPLPAAPTAAQTERLCYGIGLQNRDNGANTMSIAIPDMYLPEGGSFDTTGITADDDYGTPQFEVEEWLVI